MKITKKMRRIFHTNPTIYNMLSFTNVLPMNGSKNVFEQYFRTFLKKPFAFIDFCWPFNASNQKLCNYPFDGEFDAEQFFADVLWRYSAYSERYGQNTDFGGSFNPREDVPHTSQMGSFSMLYREVFPKCIPSFISSLFFLRNRPSFFVIILLYYCGSVASP